MVWLVARREIVTRLRERALLISTLITLALLAAIVLLPQLLDDGGRERVDVAAAGSQAERVVRAARAQGAALGLDVRLRRTPDDAAARRLVAGEEGREGEAEGADAAVVARGARIVARPGAPEGAVTALQLAARDLRARAALAERGVTGAAAAAVLAPPPLPVEETGGNSGTGRAVASVALLLLYGQLIAYGFWVAAGVVEEKASRVVELLLAAVRPRELLAGKVLGIGIVGLGQLLVVAAAALCLALATDQLELREGAVEALVVTLAWFVVGYAFYACAFAAAGALVPRQEEVQNVTSPMLLALVGTFFLAFPAAEDPGSALARVLSYLPPSAPMVMPVRMIAGDVGVVEVLASLLACAAGIVAVMLLAARVYARAVLRTGSRVGLAAVLRGRS